MVACDILSQYSVALRRLGAPSLLHEFVLFRGREFEPASLPRGVKRGRAKECFANATRLMTRGLPGVVYVEGFAMTPRLGLPIHHAWCADELGRVIDPTWPDPEACAYFGVPLSGEELYEALAERKFYGVLTDDIGRPNLDLVRGLSPSFLDDFAQTAAEFASQPENVLRATT